MAISNIVNKKKGRKLKNKDNCSDRFFKNSCPVIYITTPCYNRVETIDQSILSIFSQAGDFSIRYHVQDGGSIDGTLELLSLWKKRLEKRYLPLQCKSIVFTFASGPDNGMYDALAKGFETMSAPPDAFMTWLNADDILMPGALAFIYSLAERFPREQVSWVSGAASVIKKDMQITQSERSIPSEVIKFGLCDGTHWNFVQQEGTFFRKWLWDEVGAGDAVRDFKYAGDWNLWRLFAQHAVLATVQWPLAAFRMREGQISQNHMDEYHAEIESAVSRTQRIRSLREIVKNQRVKGRILNVHYPSGKMSLVEKGVDEQARYFYNKCFDEWPPPKPLSEAPQGKLRAIKKWISSALSQRSRGGSNSKKKKKEYQSEHVNIASAQPSQNSEHQAISTKAIPIFFIVTPCLNAADTIDQTIRSVISQAGDFSIRYHVQDGGSTDKTIDRLQHWGTLLSGRHEQIHCRGVEFTWTSEPDQGMYDAIIKGFDTLFIPPDDFMTWINADDILMIDALSTLCKISLNHPEVQWIGGPKYVTGNDASILKRDVPAPTAVIREGLCDGFHWHFLQQEGTFFKKSLWFKGRHALRDFKLAGDWSLWREFARHAEYVQCEKPLGACHRFESQLSIAKLEGYKQEMETVLPRAKRAKAFALLREMKDLHSNLIRLDTSSGEPVLEKDQTTVQKEFEIRWKTVSME